MASPSASPRSPTRARAPAAPQAPRISDADAQMMREAVLYRDDYIIVLNSLPGPAHARRHRGRTAAYCRRSGRIRSDLLTWGQPKPRLRPPPRGHSGVLLAGPVPQGGRGTDPRLPRPDTPQDLLGRHRGRAQPADGHDPLRPRQGARPWACRRGREDAHHPPQGTPWPRPRAPSPPPPITPTLSALRHAGGMGGPSSRHPASRTHQLRAHTWPPSAHTIRGDGKITAAVAKGKTSATAGARNWAARSAASWHLHAPGPSA